MLQGGCLNGYALTPGMMRLKWILLLVLVAAFAVEPTLHNHPLIPAAGDSAVSSLATSCPACTVSDARFALAAPTVDAPRTVAYTLVAVAESVPSKQAALPRASRAPPAA